MHLITHPDCLAHEVPEGHPECGDRLQAVMNQLEHSGLLQNLVCRDASPASAEQLEAVHSQGMLNALEITRPADGLVAVDADTSMGPHSLSAAAHAAGAVIDGVRAVLLGETSRVFCAVRPPGHHAEADASMGFCLYNSIAVGANVALADLQRVAILDFDVHHGNGTVDVFKDRPEVLVCSSFQHPFYPFRYADIKRDHIINTPLAAGTTGDVFRHAIERDWLPALQNHRPELILVSAGFDAHAADPLAQLCLQEDDFRWVTELIVDQATRYAEGRVVSALEGGYDLGALATSVQVHLEALAEIS
jgi:acetoin utilization deacetylase AcuC-like enzyme